jgi:hypothetical protein
LSRAHSHTQALAALAAGCDEDEPDDEDGFCIVNEM